MSSPFGIELYTSTSALNINEQLMDMKYRVIPSAPHPAFVDYLVQATPSLGVVWIKGISAYRDIDAFGNALRAEVDKIAEQLRLRYGQSNKSDFLLTGSLWDEPQYWMNALQDGQRHYCYVWSKESGASLPEDLESVYVGALSGGHESGAVAIEYSSVRINEADAEVQSKLADLL